MTSHISHERPRHFASVLRYTLFANAIAILSTSALAVEPSIHIGPKQSGANVMKNAMPKLPAFAPLSAKKGYVRGYVKDASGRPLAGAKLGVRSTATGGSYSGAQGTSDARGYYEIKVPWGAAHFYCEGYTIDYGEGRAALGLHPADGEASSFPSGEGAIENWVLLPYGVADRDEASERPFYSGNYYGGTLSVDFQVADPRPLFSNDDYLPAGSQVELTFIPVGKLVDGTQGRSFTVLKSVTDDGFSRFAINNVPIGTYRISAHLLKDGQSSPLRLQETGPSASLSFGLEPKEARGEATLTFRPSGTKPESAIGQHGNWDSLAITLKKGSPVQSQSWHRPSPNTIKKVTRGTSSLCADPIVVPDTQPPVANEFKPLGPVKVRLDDLQLLPNSQLRVSATYKNASPKRLSMPGGSIDVTMADADGVGFSAIGELYRASGDNLEALPYKLELEPEGELKIGYLFRLPVGMTAPRALTFRDSYTNTGTQEFDISSLEVPGVIAAATTPAGAVGGSTSFGELGDFDVRLDGVKRGRGNKIHAFVTIKNVGAKRLRITSGDIQLLLSDGAGVQTRNIGNLYRASGEDRVEPTGISNAILIEPKAEARIRFVFPVVKDQSPNRLIISTYNDQKQTYALPTIP